MKLASSGQEQQLRWKQAREEREKGGAGVGSEAAQADAPGCADPAATGSPGQGEEGRAASAADAGKSDAAQPLTQPPTVIAKERAALKAEAERAARGAKEAERRQEAQQRHSELVEMLRNIPFVECTIPACSDVSNNGESYVAYEIRIEVRTTTPHSRPHGTTPAVLALAARPAIARIRSGARHAPTGSPPPTPPTCPYTPRSLTARSPARPNYSSWLAPLLTLLTHRRALSPAHARSSSGSLKSQVPRDAFREAKTKVLRRYSEFVALHEVIQKGWGRQIKPPLELPAKKWFSLSQSARDARRQQLEAYLQQLTRSLNWAIHPEIRQFFECEKWLKPRKPRTSSAAPSAKECEGPQV